MQVPAVTQDDDFEKGFPSRCGHGCWGGDGLGQIISVDVDNQRTAVRLPVCRVSLLGAALKSRGLIAPITKVFRTPSPRLSGWCQ